MLPKHYDAAEIEPRMAALWRDADAFRAGAGAREGADAFSIVIPPPNVTGSLHMGHALNNTLQDVMVRYRRMCGLDVLWQPGTDHAGIATQMVVERQLAQEGTDRRSLGREAFLERVWAWKEQSGGRIEEQLQRLGASLDWSRERFTMDEGLSEAVREVFVRLHQEGLIYRAKRLVNWDPHFQTSISDLEVEARDVDGCMWHFKYPLANGATYEYVERDADGTEMSRETRDYISIATTRPETMLGDGAVAVHPSDERYAPIVGKLCEIPVGPKSERRLIPIITDEYPDPAFGSGAVKITGAHDFNDYGVASRNAIPMYRLMDERGHMRDDGEPYAREASKARRVVAAGGKPDASAIDAINLVPDEYRGLDRFVARERVIADIDAEGLMIAAEDKRITQPFGDRSGVVIEPMLTDQWFCDAEALARPAIAAVREGRTRFVPQQWENTYFHWMENIQPWCISRQLWWGHRIPAWYGPDGKVFVARSSDVAAEMAARHYGADTQLTQDEDVLDTWFSSALWPFSTLGWPDGTPELARYYPTSVLSAAFDIIFFWVARMMMMGLHFTGSEPFHTVYMHPLVRDRNGAKMSKSKGNGIDPLDLIDRFGADALRFDLATQAVQGRDVRMDEARVEVSRNFGTKLWNATRFAAMNDAVHGTHFDAQAVERPVNRWILAELDRAFETVTTGLEAYRFNDAATAAYRFVRDTFCDWYVELAKTELDVAPDETRATMGFALDRIYVLLHPFMPFLTEELWQSTAERDGLLCHARWQRDLPRDEAAADGVGWVVETVSALRSLRAEMNVKPKQKLTLATTEPNAADRAEAAASTLAKMARIERIERVAEPPKGSAQILVRGVTFFVPLAGLVDVDAESARLAKARDGASKDVAQFEKKLGNERFVANAPDAVVEEAREKLAAAREKREVLERALERVAALAS